VSLSPPARFVEVLASIKDAAIPADVRLEEIPAPTRAADFAVALEAEVVDHLGNPAASATFVALHQVGGREVWRGDLRCVTVAKATVEPELGPDPFVAQVAWSYLAEALEDVPLVGPPSGTVTRTVSESFGELKLRPDHVGLEVRASWTPASVGIGPQLEAYLGFLTYLGGVEPLPAGVANLATRMGRPARDRD
jgi:hypothetical protein